MNSINLKLLSECNPNELPEWVWLDSIVYLCKPINNVSKSNGYVGQTRMNLYSRWVSGGKMSHLRDYNNGDPRVIYLALRKHGLENFELSILGQYHTDKERIDAEVDWISKLHTYCHDKSGLGTGYNMTKGGEDCPQLRKALLKKYPNTNGAPTEWIEAGLKIITSKEVLDQKRVDNIIESLPNKMNKLYDSGLELTSLNFKRVNQDGNIVKRIRNVIFSIDDLRKDPRWTSDMELIFSGFKVRDSDWRLMCKDPNDQWVIF